MKYSRKQQVVDYHLLILNWRCEGCKRNVKNSVLKDLVAVIRTKTQEAVQDGNYGMDGMTTACENYRSSEGKLEWSERHGPWKDERFEQVERGKLCGPRHKSETD